MKFDFLKMLGLADDQRESYGTLFVELESLLSDFDEERVRHLTGVAGLLSKVARADFSVTDDERASLESILSRHLSLETTEAAAVAGVVLRVSSRLAGIEDHRYTRMINDFATKEQKLDLLSLLFEVAAADGEIGNEEEREIGSIAVGLKLTRQDFLKIRQRFREYVSVLKNLPPREPNRN